MDWKRVIQPYNCDQDMEEFVSVEEADDLIAILRQQLQSKEAALAEAKAKITDKDNTIIAGAIHVRDLQSRLAAAEAKCWHIEQVRFADYAEAFHARIADLQARLAAAEKVTTDKEAYHLGFQAGESWSKARITSLEEKVKEAEDDWDELNAEDCLRIAALEAELKKATEWEPGEECVECPYKKKLEASLEDVKQREADGRTERDTEIARLKAIIETAKEAVAKGWNPIWELETDPAPPAPALPYKHCEKHNWDYLDGCVWCKNEPACPDAVNRAYMEGASAQFEADKRNMKPARPDTEPKARYKCPKCVRVWAESDLSVDETSGDAWCPYCGSECNRIHKKEPPRPDAEFEWVPGPGKNEARLKRRRSK